MTEPVGLGRGLTNYGDPDFALYLRRSFARSMGYSLEMLSRRKCDSSVAGAVPFAWNIPLDLNRRNSIVA